MPAVRKLDGDCPKGVLAIYDDPRTGDRYTVFYKELISDGWIGYRAMSSNPFDPHGIGLYGEMEASYVSAYRYRNRHRACRWSDLPEKVQRCVHQDLSVGG